MPMPPLFHSLEGSSHRGFLWGRPGIIVRVKGFGIEQSNAGKGIDIVFGRGEQVCVPGDGIARVDIPPAGEGEQQAEDECDGGHRAQGIDQALIGGGGGFVHPGFHGVCECPGIALLHFQLVSQGRNFALEMEIGIGQQREFIARLQGVRHFRRRQAGRFLFFKVETAFYKL